MYVNVCIWRILNNIFSLIFICTLQNSHTLEKGEEPQLTYTFIVIVQSQN